MPRKYGLLRQTSHRFWRSTILIAVLGAVAGIMVSSELPPLASTSREAYVQEGRFAGDFLAAQFAKQEGMLEQAAPLYQQLSRNVQGDVTLTNQAYLTQLKLGNYDEALRQIHQHSVTETLDVAAQLLVIMDAVRNEHWQEVLDRLDNIVPATEGTQKTTIGEYQNLLKEVIIPVMRSWAFMALNHQNEALDTLYACDHPYMQPFIFTQELLMRAANGDVNGLEENKDLFNTSRIPDYMRPILVSALEKADPVNYKSRITDSIVALANILTADAQWDNAAVYFRLALYAAPTRENSVIMLADVLIEQGYYSTARSLLSTITDTHPLFARAQRTLANALFRAGDTKQATALLRAFINQHHDAHEHILQLADMLMKDNQYHEAAALYSDVIAAQPQETPDMWVVYYVRGISYEQTNQWEKAEQDFLKALDLSPAQPDVLNYLAYSWLQQDRNIHDAHRMLKQAVEQRPNDPHILDSYGWALFKLGEFERAESFLELATQLMPHDRTVNQHLGDAYWRMGRTAEARNQWQRVLSYGPENVEDEAILKQKIADGLPALQADKPLISQPLRPNNESKAQQSVTQ